MSSFVQIQLEEGDEAQPAAADSQKPSPNPPAEPSPDPASTEASGSASTATPATPPSEPAGTTPTAQAAAAFQSVLSFLGGSGEAQLEQTQDGSAEAAVVDDDPEAPLEDPVAEFEKEAMDAAMQAEAAVKEVGQKLLHGATEAKESLSSLAQGFTSWWSKLDPVSSSASPSAAAQSSIGGGGAASSSQRVQDVQQAADSLGLDGGETVLESFACQLLQTYTCSSNFFTPVRQIPFSGSLHITSQRLCFAFEDKGVAPIKLPGKAIKSVTKQAADMQKGLPERLELQLDQAGQSLVLAHFSLQGLEMDSALALIEHLS